MHDNGLPEVTRLSSWPPMINLSMSVNTRPNINKRNTHKNTELNTAGKQ